jgi:hypothetical protein
VAASRVHEDLAPLALIALLARRYGHHQQVKRDLGFEHGLARRANNYVYDDHFAASTVSWFLLGADSLLIKL